MPRSPQENPSVFTDQIEAFKQELLDIRSGWEWAFANGARCNGGHNHPSLQAVLDRERELNALISEHTG